MQGRRCIADIQFLTRHARSIRWPLFPHEAVATNLRSVNRSLRVVGVGVVHTVIGNAKADERVGVELHTAFGLLNLVNHPTKSDMRKRVRGGVFLNATTDIAMRTCKPAFDDGGLGLAGSDLVVWLPECDIPFGPTLVEADGVPKNLDRVVRTERKVTRDDGPDTRDGIPDGCSANVKQSHNMTNQTPRKSIATSLQNVVLKEGASGSRSLYILYANATCVRFTVSG